MSIRLKYFTVEEADALIPEISGLLRTALDVKTKIEVKVEEWRKEHDTATEAEEALLRGQVDFLAAQLERELGRIAELGAVPKDLDAGLVDFPARIEDREAYLCWRAGEPRVSFWHGLTEGFRGRKPIERSGK